jgi:DNA invertase Pin-like site-specific DNA recombinase
MKIGYARVSTDDQRLDLQRDALLREGCDTIFEEKITGTSRCRPALSTALAKLTPGDVLVVWKLDRLGRSLKHLVEIIQQLDERHIGFHSLSDNIDTTSSSGKLLFHIMGAIAEFECAQISERTKAGLSAARRKGKRIGRPPSMSNALVEEARILQDKEHLSLACIAHRFRISKTTLWRALRCNTSRSRQISTPD